MYRILFVIMAVVVFLCTPDSVRAAEPSKNKLYILAGMPGYYTLATPKQVAGHVKGLTLGNAAFTNDDGERITPLMRAAEETPYPEVIDILMKAGSDINAVSYTSEKRENPRTPYKRTALHFAVDNPNIDVLERLLSYTPDFTALHTSENNRSVLALAADRKGGSNHFFMLIEAGATPRANELQYGGLWGFLRTEKGTCGEEKDCEKLVTSPDVAAAMTREVLKFNPVADTVPLNKAIQVGHSGAAIEMLKAGYTPERNPERGLSVLQKAFSYRPFVHDLPDPTVELLKMLLPYSNINDGTTGPDGEILQLGTTFDSTPFALACQASMSVEVVKFLVDSGARYTTTTNTPLIQALEASRDNPELVAYLLELGFSPSRENETGATPLDAAFRTRLKVRSIPLLIRAGADPGERVFNTDIPGRREEALVAAGVYSAKGELLIPVGKNESDVMLNKADAEALLAAARQYPEKALYSSALYVVATPDQLKDIIGSRSLKKVRTTTRTYSIPDGIGPGAMVGNMLSLIYRPKQKITTYDTPFTYAARVTPYPEVIDVLVEAGADVRALKSEALALAVMNNNPKVLEAVLRHNPDPEAPMYDDGTPLHYLAWAKEATLEHLHLLLKAKPNLNARDRDDETPLMRAIHWKREDRARILLAAGADVNAATRHGTSALAMAIDEGLFDLADELIKAGAVSRESEKRDSPLVAAAKSTQQGSEAILLTLLKQVGPESPQALAALHAAALAANLRTYSLLRENGVPFNKEAMERVAGELIYAQRLRKEDAAMLERLLAEGVDPNAKNRFGTPFLLAATEWVQADMAEVLVKAGANVHERTELGFTPLLAVLLQEYSGPDELDARRLHFARVLVAGGADVHAETSEGWNAMQLGMNKPGVIAVLQQAGADVNHMAGNGWRPLALAVANPNYKSAIVPLMLAGADSTLKTEWNATAWDTAYRKHDGRALALLEQGWMATKTKRP